MARNKGLSVLLIIFSLLAWDCKRNNLNSSSPLDLNGKWEIRGQVGGIAGYIQFPKGNGTQLIFNANGTYSRYIQDTLYKSGQYSLQTITAQRTQQPEKFIFFDGVNSNSYYQIQSDTLTIHMDGTGQALGTWYIKTP